MAMLHYITVKSPFGRSGGRDSSSACGGRFENFKFPFTSQFTIHIWPNVNEGRIHALPYMKCELKSYGSRFFVNSLFFASDGLAP